jgi:5-hydroxyisourate hydrolase
MTTASLSSHVLDLQQGQPARGLSVTVHSFDGRTVLACGLTDNDGRVKSWTPALALLPGQYTLVFETGAWYAAQQQETLYPSVRICFSVSAVHDHYHIPLLLSPFGYSTYRGS